MNTQKRESEAEIVRRLERAYKKFHPDAKPRVPAELPDAPF